MTPAVVVPEVRVPPVDPGWAAKVPAEHIPALIGHLAAAVAQLAAREMAPSANGPAPNGRHPDSTSKITTEEWLTVAEAAEKYKSSESWLYRKARRLGFGKKLGAKLLISVSRLEQHLDQGVLR